MPTLHWAVRMNFRNRLICGPLLLLMLGWQLWDAGAPGWAYAVLAAQMLGAPYAMLALARASHDPLAAEQHNIKLDCVLIGLWVGALHFPLWIAVVSLISVSLHPMIFRGPRALATAVGLSVAAAMLAWALSTWSPSRATSAAVTALAITHLGVYLLVLTLGAYRSAVVANRLRQELRESREALRERLSEVESLQERLREQAQRDPLTGLYNRRFVDAFMEREIAQARRDSGTIVVMILDIDHFKRINDTHGHLAGDQVIRDVARMIEKSARSSDIIARFGGEEFLVIMPRADLDGAIERAQRLRQSLESQPSSFEGQVITRTVSIGVAAFPRDGQTQDEIVGRADAALYQAKRGGRNRVISSSQSSTPHTPASA